MDREEFKALLKEALVQDLEVAVAQETDMWGQTRVTVKVKFDREVISEDFFTVRES